MFCLVTFDVFIKTVSIFELYHLTEMFKSRASSFPGFDDLRVIQFIVSKSLVLFIKVKSQIPHHHTYN